MALAGASQRQGGGGDGGVGGGFHRQGGLVDGELGTGVGGGLLHGRQGRSLAPAVDGPDGDVVLGQGVEVGGVQLHQCLAEGKGYDEPESLHTRTVLIFPSGG